MTAPFLLEPTHSSFLRGNGGTLRSPKAASVAVAVVMVLVGAGFCAFGLHAWRQDRDLVARGALAQGRVLSMHIDDDGDSTTYKVLYEVPISQGRWIHAEHSVSHASYDRLSVGGPIEILYLPEDPSR